ncbi:MAG: helix-turn-helix transcriptional regulator [Proteobacteria bacterium]|nr:helix-turn-helix transcriptional regulator [Pseudomonadota bacterium]
MLCLLRAEGELCVCDFVEVLGITQSKASRHLRCLVNVGLLQDRREAVWVYFRIAADPGPLEAAVLSGVRALLPARLPAPLGDALRSWRRRKAGARPSCKPPRKAPAARERRP